MQKYSMLIRILKNKVQWQGGEEKEWGVGGRRNQEEVGEAGGRDILCLTF